MSCNGCRVLRKGCSESCILRPCLQWMESPEAQGHATVFVAKFFGRAGLMSFISNVPENKRPALFQSLLFEACGRTVNPVSGAAGLLWAGNWSVCQAAVETVLLGGTLSPMLELIGINRTTSATDEFSEAEVTCTDMLRVCDPRHNTKKFSARKSKRPDESTKLQMADLDFRLMHGFVSKAPVCTKGVSINSEESAATTACLDSVTADRCLKGGGRKLLNLFI